MEGLERFTLSFQLLAASLNLGCHIDDTAPPPLVDTSFDKAAESEDHFCLTDPKCQRFGYYRALSVSFLSILLHPAHSVHQSC